MRLHYPLNSQGAEDAGKLPWIDGVPATGVEGSYPGHAIVTDVEAEILSMIDLAGFVRNGSDLTQAMQAAARGIWLGQFGGTAVALSATLPNNVVVPSLQVGVRLRGIAASNYPGGGGTLAIVGVGPSASSVLTCPIVGPDGTTTLGSGAWKAGQILTFDVDTSGNARFSGAAALPAFKLTQPATNLPNGAVTTLINWATSAVACASAVSAAAGSLTVAAAEAGLWALSAGASTNGQTTSEIIDIRVNGASIVRDSCAASANFDLMDRAAATFARLAAGDVVTVTYAQTNTNGSTLPTGTPSNAEPPTFLHFTGIRLGS